MTGLSIQSSANEHRPIPTGQNQREVSPTLTTFSINGIQTKEELVAIYRDYVRSSVSYAKYFAENGRDKEKRDVVANTLSNKGTKERLNAVVSRGVTHAALMPFEDASRLLMEDINYVLFGSPVPPRC